MSSIGSANGLPIYNRISTPGFVGGAAQAEISALSADGRGSSVATSGEVGRGTFLSMHTATPSFGEGTVGLANTDVKAWYVNAESGEVHTTPFASSTATIGALDAYLNADKADGKVGVTDTPRNTEAWYMRGTATAEMPIGMGSYGQSHVTVSGLDRFLEEKF